MPKTRRPGGGRKPLPAALAPNSHESKASQEKRLSVEKNLETTANLTCPKDMSDTAKKEWKRLMRLYRKMPAQVLNDLDLNSLRQYCEHFSVYYQAEQAWKDDLKCTVASSSVDTQSLINRVLETMRRETDAMNRLAEQLLLTPVGRARMGVNPATPNTGDKIEEFISRISGGADKGAKA